MAAGFTAAGPGPGPGRALGEARLAGLALAAFATGGLVFTAQSLPVVLPPQGRWPDLPRESGHLEW
jgi:hypothetical protein